MGILDEAIREHIELKRQHGAPESEVKDLEDEAFGPPERPGEAEGAVATESAPESEMPPTPEPEPPTPAPKPPTPAPEPPTPAPEPPTPAPEPPTPAPGPPTPAPEPPTPTPEPPPATESVVDQPTEYYDVEGEPAEPGAELEETQPEEEEDYFSEQSLSDELDSALGESESEVGLAPEEPAEPAPSEPAEPEPAEPAPPPEGGESATLAPEPSEGESSEEGGAFFDQEDDGEDVLEETPEFLQDTPEHDRLWFEQKPPKDFDFDD